ncbi:DUF1189 domain-containing protein [Carnobacterium inhibens]|uniref:DUF1189 domain-containing protein n=1 Tax=Carnobacterium inhibens TaxID=147709 RepID=A0ABR7TEA6_9LACT|nr:DUF1189 domain-containing protein [Carnobacterium inhibens]
MEFIKFNRYNKTKRFVYKKRTVKKSVSLIKSGEIIIQLLSLFKNSLLHPEKLVQALSLKKGKIILYLLVIATIAAIPTWVQGSTLISEFGRDGQIIAGSIPEFTIENEQLVTKEPVKSFIYKTNSIIFTFDPNGERTVEDVNLDQIGNIVAIALLEDRLYVNLPGYPIQLTYAQLNGLTSATFIDILFNIQSFSGTAVIFTFLILWLATLFVTVLYTLLYTLFANCIALITGKALKFGDNFKIILFASTLPTLFIALLNTFGLVPSFQLEIKAIMTLFIYYLAVRTIPKIERLP